jgi:hypothetical protein
MIARTSGKYTDRILAYFATNVAKNVRRSQVYILHPKEKSLDFLGFIWPNRDFSISYGESK